MFTFCQHRHVFTCFMIATLANNLQNGYLVRLSADFVAGLQRDFTLFILCVTTRICKAAGTQTGGCGAFLAYLAI
jgi:hypothetical protein